MIASPGTSFSALGFMFGLVVFLAGLAELLHAVRQRNAGSRRWHLVLGIIDILLGIILMGHVTAGMEILRIIAGIWFILRGISLFGFSRLVGKSWLLITGGVLTTFFGLLLLFFPIIDDMTIIIWAALAFIITGIFNVILGISLQKALP